VQAELSDRRRAIAARGGPLYSHVSWAPRGLHVRACAAVCVRANASHWHCGCAVGQLTKGLQHLCSRLIVHRDVKPDNMLLGSGFGGGGGASAAFDGEDDADVLMVVSDLGECLDCRIAALHDFVVSVARRRSRVSVAGGASAAAVGGSQLVTCA
jgi:hypothetical protein